MHGTATITLDIFKLSPASKRPSLLYFREYLLNYLVALFVLGKQKPMGTSDPYSPPLFLFSSHLETIFPALLRRVQLQAYTRERITTPDDDFLDLDWLKNGSEKVVI